MKKALRENLQVWHLLLGFVVFALGGAVSLGMTYQKIQTDLEYQKQDARQMQDAIVNFGAVFNQAAQDLAVTRRDVEWIRRELERENR